MSPGTPTTDRALSPVVAVVLLVGITVALAAVASVLAFGIGSRTGGSPHADFDFEYNGSGVEITHRGGAALAADEVTVRVDGATEDWSEDDGEIQTGDRWHLEPVSGGESIRVVWEDGDGGGEILGRFEVP